MDPIPIFDPVPTTYGNVVKRSVNKVVRPKPNKTISLYPTEQTDGHSKYVEVLNVLKSAVRQDSLNVKSVNKFRNNGVVIN
ncbi:hypothetical protein AVEN_75313-1 [Araneus ventricosus]|uniref:Uncharacterized protein n=1 Tax=Araneus ventricosus TaxID=182803 RepID=A0A4Y2G5L1_ARAVE|nr:hypothetical protein AVEN_75313-1 [Araneus ventricosus]